VPQLVELLQALVILLLLLQETGEKLRRRRVVPGQLGALVVGLPSQHDACIVRHRSFLEQLHVAGTKLQ
jgi:hypothetical protein